MIWFGLAIIISVCIGVYFRDEMVSTIIGMSIITLLVFSMLAFLMSGVCSAGVTNDDVMFNKSSAQIVPMHNDLAIDGKPVFATISKGGKYVNYKCMNVDTKETNDKKVIFSNSVFYESDKCAVYTYKPVKFKNRVWYLITFPFWMSNRYELYIPYGTLLDTRKE
jgi:hypothetical protein